MGLPGADPALIRAASSEGGRAASAALSAAVPRSGGPGAGRRIGAFRVRVHPLFLAAGVLSAFTGQLLFFLSAVLAALEHEFAHAIAARSEGYCLDKIVLMPYGAVISGDLSGIPPRAEAKVLLAGPLANAFTALAFAALWWLFPETYPYTEAAAEVSLSLFLVNLLPAYPLDGGRILHLALSRFGERRARLICRAVTMFVAAGVLAYFVRSCFSRPAWTALVFSVLLAAGAFGGARYSRLTFLRGKSFSRGVEERRVVIDAARTVQDALRYLTEERYLVLVLYAEGEYLGELTEEEYLAALSAGKYAEPLSECLPKL